MLRINNISKELGDFMLEKVSFEVEKGDYFVLLGESGVGKSVLLEIITGLIDADDGNVDLEHNDITRTKIQDRDVGLVYQDQSLFPHLSVRNNIAYPLKCIHLTKEQIKKEVETLAENVGIAHLLDRETETLSIGEAQRTALARTLATKPKVLLLDEPLASLDVKAKSTMRSLLRKINKEGQTIVHVTHDYEEAIALAKHIAVLEKGTVVQTGIPEEIFQHPKSEFIASFTGIRNFYRGELSKISDDLSTFTVDGLEFDIATDLPEGKACVILRSEDITISKTEPKSSARNHFKGTIIDIEPAKVGIEVMVDIGVRISALITRESLEKMNLSQQQKVWANFKASSARCLKE